MEIERNEKSSRKGVEIRNEIIVIMKQIEYIFICIFSWVIKYFYVQIS